ncbi:MAG: ribosomal-protein-alanine N-acetyltransferase [Crocinitomix sp.]|jgi:ribosomal-protein-alanine N-acetyltransferase
MPINSVILTTSRLLLREFHEMDATSFYQLNKNIEVMRYTGDLVFESVAASRKFIDSYTAYADSGFGRWTVILKETNEFLGWCGLKKHPDGMVDLGYRFHQKHWGKGYATEAAQACISHGFKELGIKEIIGRTARLNLASVRVLEKIGMKYWKDAPCEGIIDSVFYRISK